MNFFLSILLFSLFLSCKDSNSHKFKSNINKQFSGLESFGYNNENNLVGYKVFKPSSLKEVLFRVDYENDTIVSSSKDSELVIAREQFENGKVIFYTVSPPLLIMETLLDIKYKNNILKRDTIYGNVVTIDMNEIKEVYLEFAAVDTIINRYVLEGFTYSPDSLYNTGLIYK